MWDGGELKPKFLLLWIAVPLMAWGQVPKHAAAKINPAPASDSCHIHEVTNLPGSHEFGSHFLEAMAGDPDPKAKDRNVVWGLTADLSSRVPAHDRALYISKSSDGGKTWSSRTLNSPFPIRELRFITPKIGWAAGGNVYSNIGGAYFSTDGGQTWKADLDTQGHELASCAAMNVPGGTRVWCAGFALQSSRFNSAVYSTLYKTAR